MMLKTDMLMPLDARRVVLSALPLSSRLKKISPSRSATAYLKSKSKCQSLTAIQVVFFRTSRWMISKLSSGASVTLYLFGWRISAGNPILLTPCKAAHSTIWSSSKSLSPSGGTLPLHFVLTSLHAMTGKNWSSMSAYGFPKMNGSTFSWPLVLKMV